MRRDRIRIWKMWSTQRTRMKIPKGGIRTGMQNITQDSKPGAISVGGERSSYYTVRYKLIIMHNAIPQGNFKLRSLILYFLSCFDKQKKNKENNNKQTRPKQNKKI